MSISYELRISNLPSDHRPDSFNLLPNKKGSPLPPSDNFIISRNVDGSELSKFSDHTWDISPYHYSSTKCRLNFKTSKTKNLSEDYIQQMKWLMICSTYLTPKALSTSSYLLYLKVFRNITIYCSEKSIPNISELFSSYSLLKKYHSDTKPAIQSMLTLLRAMSHLSQTGQEITGISITTDIRLNELCTHLDKSRQESICQTLPIPSRIYLMRIEQLDAMLNEYISHKQSIISLLQACINETHYGLSKLTQRQRGRGYSHRKSKLSGKPCLPFCPDFDEALSEYGLTDFAKKNGFQSRQTFATFINKVRYVCKHQIHLFSGMRDDEVNLLKYGCYIRESMTWGEAHFLTGITNKMHKSRKLTRWVTCKAIEPAIDLTESITKVVAEHLGFDPKDCSLFIPIGLFKYRTIITKPDDCQKF